MGKILHMKFMNLLSMLLFFSMTLVSCLPMQKTTQCGTGEAFNATRRKCVPVVGAATSNTVTIQSKSPSNSYTTTVSSSAVTHTVAISDVYNYGYTVYWYVHYQDPNLSTTTTTLAAINTASFSFNPSIRPAGQYILEAVLLDQDANNQLDTVSWNITISALAQPTIANPIPAATAYSYADTITSATLSVDIENDNDISGYYYFIRDGVTVAGPTLFITAQTISTTIDPSALALGIHTLEVKLVSASNLTNVLDNYVWVLNVVNPNLPLIQTASATPPLGDTITIVNGVNFSSGGWRDQNNAPLTIANALCITVDDADKDSIPGSDIDVEFKVAGNSIGYGVQSTNTFCLSSVNLDAAQSYFNLSNPDVAESKSINVVTYRTGTTTQVESMNWNVVVRPKNIRPVISIDGVTTSSSLGCTASTSVLYSSCIMTQSVNYNEDSGDTDYVDAEDTDNVVQLGINLDYDPDITAETDFEVFFQVKKATVSAYEDMDGASQYTYTDCTYDDTDTSGSVDSGDKYVCNLRMDAFNDLGSLAPGNYVVKAYIRDANNGTGWDVGNPKDSNILTWEINVQERQSTGTIDIGPFVAAAPATGESWIQSGGTSCGVGGSVVSAVTENDVVFICSAVRDLERDNFNISIELSNGFFGGYSTISSTSLVTRTTNTEWRIVEKQVTIPQWAVTGTATAATVKVSVQDKPNSATTPICFTCDSTTESFAITVTNFNPMPQFNDDDTAPNFHADLSLSSVKVFAGMPFEVTSTSNLDVSANFDTAYSDASIYDGANVNWKWTISTDAGLTWAFIPGAEGSGNSTASLKWTPDPDVTAGLVSLRLCLGDDGGNDVTTWCTDSAPVATYDGAYREWQNIQVYPSNMQLTSTNTNTSSGNEISHWYDSSPGTNFLYTAYTTGTKIYVEKMGYDSNGALTTIHNISFDTEDADAGLTPTSVYDLTVTGIPGKALLISYGILEVQSQTPQFRVRRIDLNNDTFSFSYCGLYNPTPTSPHTASCADLVDSTTNLDADAAVTFSTNATKNVMSITFSDNPTAGDLVFITQAGNVSFAFGTDYCVGVTCTSGGSAAADAALSADDLEAALNADATFALEFKAVSDGINKVDIYGPAEYDYYDNTQRITPIVGRINALASGEWFVVYSNAASSLQLGIARGDSADVTNGLGGGITPSHINLPSSSVMNQEIDNIVASSGTELYVATKNTNANLDVYLVDVSSGAIVSASYQNIFSLSGYDGIEGIQISQGMGDYVYVSGISVANSGMTRNLNLAILNSTLSEAKGNMEIDAIGYEQYVQDIDQAHVSASPTTKGEIIVAVTTNTNNPNPNKAYLTKVTYSLPGGAGEVTNTTANFHEYDYPALNTNDTVQDGSIWSGAIVQLVNKGYTNVASTTEDLSKYVLFYGFHESDAGDKIRTGFYNVETETIMTDDTTVNANFPAIIGN